MMNQFNGDKITIPSLGGFTFYKLSIYAGYSRQLLKERSDKEKRKTKKFFVDIGCKFFMFPEKFITQRQFKTVKTDTKKFSFANATTRESQL